MMKLVGGYEVSRIDDNNGDGDHNSNVDNNSEKVVAVAKIITI